VLVSLVASVCALTAVALAWASFQGVRSQQDWSAALRVCAPEELSACVESVWVDAATGQDLDALALVLSERVVSDTELARVCHDAAHAAARSLVVRAPERVPEWMVWGGDPGVPCESGFLHGLLEGAGADGRPELLEASWQACVSAASRDAALGDSCAHGLGHGVFLRSMDVSAAWRDCQGSTVNRWDASLRAMCAGGVFMMLEMLDPRWAASGDSREAQSLVVEVDRVCRALPGVDEPVDRLCPGWAALVLGADASGALVAWQFDGGSRQEAQRRVLGSLATCKALAVPQRAECRVSVADVAGSAFLGFDALAERACSVFPGRLEQVCRQGSAFGTEGDWLGV